MKDYEFTFDSEYGVYFGMIQAPDEKTFNYSIPAQYNKENIKVVVFVTEGSSKVVLNSRVAEIGETQEIEKKE